LPKGTVLAVGADDGQRDDLPRLEEAQGHEHAPVELVAVVGHELKATVVAGQRQQELGERYVVIVSERDLRTAEAAEIAAQARRRAHHVRVAVAVAVRRDDHEGLRFPHLGGETPHGRDGGAHLAERGATDLGDEQWRMGTDTALHDGTS
jgi:hypothetical protein